jgi:hypothetical protein
MPLRSFGQPCREDAPPKDMATYGPGCGFRRKRGTGPSVNRSVIAPDDVTEAPIGLSSNRQAERKVVLFDGAHSITRLIVLSYPGVDVWPGNPSLGLGFARKPR